MKFSIVQILFSSLVIAQAQEAWFVPSKNATCRGYPDGHIGCEPGHVDNALEASFLGFPRSRVKLTFDKFVPQGVPAVRGREPNPLDKRLTCNIDGVTRGLACATHCFAINFW